LPYFEALENKKENMSFNYNTVAKEDLEMVFVSNALRIRPKNDKNFG